MNEACKKFQKIRIRSFKICEFDPGAPVSTPSFGSHLNPISTRGADYAHSTMVSTQSFESHRCACSVSAPATVPLFNICLWLQLYLRWYAPLKANHALNANLIIMIHENIANICPAIIDGTWLIVLFLGI